MLTLAHARDDSSQLTASVNIDPAASARATRDEASGIYFIFMFCGFVINWKGSDY